MSERYWPCGVCPLSFDFCRCDAKQPTPLPQQKNPEKISDVGQAEDKSGTVVTAKE